MTAENRPRHRTRYWESQKFFGLAKLTELWHARRGGAQKRKEAHHKLQDERTWTCTRMLSWQQRLLLALMLALAVSKPPVLRQAKQLPCIQKSFQWSFASGTVSGSGSGHGQPKVETGTHTHTQRQTHKMAAAAAQKVSWRMKNFLAMPRTSSSCALAAKQWRQRQWQRQLLTLAQPQSPKWKSHCQAQCFRRLPFQHRARSTALQEWQPLRLWPETKRIRWRKLKWQSSKFKRLGCQFAFVLVLVLVSLFCFFHFHFSALFAHFRFYLLT